MRARYSLVLCDFGLTTWSFSYVNCMMIKVSAGCPTFDGTDHPYWKNKMRMHLEAIHNDLWCVVENGVPSVTPSVNAAHVKRFKQLDSQEEYHMWPSEQRTIRQSECPGNCQADLGQVVQG